MTQRPPLYLVRHGLASWPPEVYYADDTQRPLTPAGIQLLETASQGLARRLTADPASPPPTLILHSPLVRARQTAAVLSAALRPARGCEAHVRLEPGFDAAGLEAIMQERPAMGALMLIGHNPDLMDLVALLTGKPARFREGTVALLTWPAAGRPRLSWLAHAEELAAR